MTNSWAVHWEARLVKPSMSAKRMLWEREQEKEEERQTWFNKRYSSIHFNGFSFISFIFKSAESSGGVFILNMSNLVNGCFISALYVKKSHDRQQSAGTWSIDNGRQSVCSLLLYNFQPKTEQGCSGFSRCGPYLVLECISVHSPKIVC